MVLVLRHALWKGPLKGLRTGNLRSLIKLLRKKISDTHSHYRDDKQCSVMPLQMKSPNLIDQMHLSTTAGCVLMSLHGL